jgi:hypothetical protein
MTKGSRRHAWRRLLRSQRGDQNVGSLGLIVVAVLIIGVLVSVLVPGVRRIVTSVMGGMEKCLSDTTACPKDQSPANGSPSGPPSGS